MRGSLPVEEYTDPESLPLHALVPVNGPNGELLGDYRGVRREDTGEVIAIVSRRYSLVGHREVARAVRRVSEALEDPLLSEPQGRIGFPRERIRLYARGRRMEIKRVIGRPFRLGAGEMLHPGLRVLNSLDGSWAIRFSGFAVRVACQNQLYAERGNVTEWREFHLSSAENILAELEVAFAGFLDRFESGLGVYRRAMNEQLLGSEVKERLAAAGLPNGHASVIGARAEARSSHAALLSRWTAYQIATEYLTHEVRVNPDRERTFERAAACALLLPRSVG